MSERWDVFCRVVDNLGDAGVCWRLARQLAHEHHLSVRMWVDDLATLARLEPSVVVAPRQRVDGIEVLHWGPHAEAGALLAEPGHVVIEGFGCGLPDDYVAAMARAQRPPLWVVLEYLSAEPWVREYHGLPSPHPSLPLRRYFFFPGFVPGTGGLLREGHLLKRREAFDAKGAEAFWRAIDHDPLPAETTAISVFAYDTAPLPALLRVWEAGPDRVVAAIPEGTLAAAALRHVGLCSVPGTRVIRRGSLEIRLVPFVPQVHYDELLWCCDFNFVRGEDSFVRAQWAARPFVWHIYPQAERAHWRKLEAFLNLYTRDLAEPAAHAIGRFMRFWNGIEAGDADSPQQLWSAVAREQAQLRNHAKQWIQGIAAIDDTADQLARFCLSKLK